MLWQIRARAEKMRIGDYVVLGYGYVTELSGSIEWDLSDRYNFFHPLADMEPYLSGLSWSLPVTDRIPNQRSGALNRLIAVGTKQYRDFVEDVVAERSSNEIGDEFWKLDYFARIQSLPLLATPTLLGYDVTTSWLKREPVPDTLLETLGVQGPLELFQSLEAAETFRGIVAPVSEGAVFTLGVFALDKDLFSPHVVIS